MNKRASLTELYQEILINQFIKKISFQKKSKNYEIYNTNIIPFTKENLILKHHSIFIKDGKIEKILPSNKFPLSQGYSVIDGKDKFIIPGLIDAHVHMLGSNADFLLALANGITTIRECCGFPWMLSLREKIQKNLFLAPNFIVGGHMLNYDEFDYFTTVVRTKDDIVRQIDKQYSLGFDFIKVWNVMPLDLLQFICDYATKKDLFVSAHIPHGISVQEAINSGIRVFEHFKGYIDDTKIKLTKEDYVSITPTIDIFNCPTFLVFKNDSLLGSEAREKFNNDKNLTFVSPFTIQEWKNDLKEKEEQFKEIKWNIPASHLKLQIEIFQKLLKKKVQFISGTDFGGGYPFCLIGFGLIEELIFTNSLGLNVYETFKTATVNFSQISDKFSKYGTIEEGKSADLIILDKNPLLNINSVKESKSVVVRGIHLEKSFLEGIFNKIKEIYQTDPFNKYNESELLKFILDYYLNNNNLIFLKKKFLDILSSYLLEENMIEQAISILKINAELSGTSTDFNKLAQVYDNFGDKEQSIKFYKLSLKENPYNQGVLNYLENNFY